MRFVLAPLILAALAFGCAPQRVVLRAPNPAEVAGPPSPLRVLPTIGKAPDPLRVDGENVQLEGVADALGNTISHAVAPWAQKHLAARPGGWELRLTLEEARAYTDDGHRTVELATSVTLDGIRGQVYLAQTHGYCKQSELLATPPENAVYACMESMARDLAGWLEGVSP